MASSPQESNRSRTGVRRVHVVAEVVVLAGLWVLFSGKLDVLHLSFGVLSVSLVVYLTRHIILPRPDTRQAPFLERLVWHRAVVYPFWLLWQILLANLHVALVILRLRPCVPVVVRFRFPVDCDVAKTTLGNSITLTPGTFTARVLDDVFVIHALDLASADSLLNGAMQKRVASVFGLPIDEPPTIEIGYSFEEFDRA